MSEVKKEIKREKVQLSLVKRLVISSIAVTAFTVILICALFYFSTSKFAERYLGNELASKVEFLKEAYREPLWSFDKAQIEHVSKSMLLKTPYSYVSYIKVETNDSDVLFEKDIDNTERNKDDLRDYDHAHKVRFDVNKDGSVIGHVTLIITNKGSLTTIKKYLGYIVIISTFCIIGFGFFIGVYFHKILSSPLKQLLSQVKHFEKGEYQHFNTSGLPFELQSVSRALNHAGEIIEKRNNDILNYTNDLETLVETRTNALKEQMQKNISTARLAAVGEMAAGVAHEINNPLTVIDLHIVKLKKNLIEPEQQKSLDKMQSMIKRTSIIIKGLKTLSRNGEQDPIAPFQILTMVEDVKSLVEMKLSSNNINFECSEIPSQKFVVGRIVQISQVLVNLIGNAIDAINVSTKESKVIKLEIIEIKGRMQFAIIDNGIGIPAALKEKIMQPFFTTKDVNKGTGLGLSISKSIIEDHGGQLEVDSDDNRTCFKFSLELVKQVDKEEKRAS
jgi:two-component system NtrC family sensor kinase